jgi:hypothetical protein
MKWKIHYLIIFIHINAIHSQSKHYVSIIEDPSVRITGVKINNKKWDAFNEEENSVTLPEQGDLRLEVTFGFVMK